MISKQLDWQWKNIKSKHLRGWVSGTSSVYAQTKSREEKCFSNEQTCRQSWVAGQGWWLSWLLLTFRRCYDDVWPRLILRRWIKPEVKVSNTMKQFKKQKSYRAFCTEDVFSAEIWSQSLVTLFCWLFTSIIVFFLKICPVKKGYLHFLWVLSGLNYSWEFLPMLKNCLMVSIHNR